MGNIYEDNITSKKIKDGLCCNVISLNSAKARKLWEASQKNEYNCLLEYNYSNGCIINNRIFQLSEIQRKLSDGLRDKLTVINIEGNLICMDTYLAVARVLHNPDVTFEDKDICIMNSDEVNEYYMKIAESAAEVNYTIQDFMKDNGIKFV